MKERHGGQPILGQPLISNPLAKIVTSGGEIIDVRANDRVWGSDSTQLDAR